MSLRYCQSQTLYQAGSGSLIGATTVTLTSLTDIYGNVLTIADFGAKGFFTCEPDTTNEESGTFTGITANANGTYTLTGVSTSLGKSPYTETSGMVRLHSGGTSVVLTDTVAFWNTFANKQNDEVITGRWSSATVPSTANDYTNKNYVDGVAIAGAPDASTTVKGVSRLTQSPNRTLGVVTVTIATPAVATFTAHGLTLNDTIQFTTTGALPTGITASTNYFVIAAGLTANTFQIATTLGGTAINTSGSQSGVHTLIRTTPYVIADTDYRMLTNSFGVDSGTANAHVVTLPYTSPSVLISGTLVSYIALNTNTLATTANVAGTGVKTIKKLAGTTDIAPGDIVAGMVIELEYSATSGFWQMLNPVANAPVTIYGDGSDGNVTISGNTTLTRDMFYDTLTVNNTFTLTTSGFRVFAKTAISNAGIIASNGVAGTVGSQGGDTVADGGGAGGAGGAGGTAIANGTIKGSVAGVTGGAGSAGSGFVAVNNGTAGTAETIGSSASNGVAGAAGGAGAAQSIGPNAGGAGGAAGVTTRITNIVTPNIAISPYIASNFIGGVAGAGSGGGGGGAVWNGLSASQAGGGGGGGSGSNGSFIVLVSPSITVTATGSITANGGVGASGGRGGNATGGTGTRNLGGGGGGAGSGGSGGVIAIVSPRYTNSGSVTAVGGAAGTGGIAGTGSSGNGTAGSNGAVGSNGYVVNII